MMHVLDFETMAVNFLNAWLTYHREAGWTLERYDYWFQSTDWLKLL